MNRIPQEDFLASLRAPTTSGYEKTISATTQEEVIAGKDGRISKSIMDNTRSMEWFGIKINALDIKGLYLPEENKESIYQQMIAERKAITAKYTASGDKTLSDNQARVDAESRQIVSEANKKKLLRSRPMVRNNIIRYFVMLIMHLPIKKIFK